MQQFGIFAKYWQPGSVKTRLAASIGDNRSSELYRCFLATLLRRFAKVAERRVLAYTPDDRRDEFVALGGNGWDAQPQATGDLGKRMAAYFESAFASGAERVVLIGSDSPTLPVAYVEQAFQLLDNHSTVLGPSEDGGYYLVGSRATPSPIFSDIQWSTSSVWKQTIQLLKSHNTPFAILPSWYDVDDYDDLCRLRAELESAPKLTKALGALLDAMPSLM